MKLGLEKMGELYKRSDVFVVNVEESQLILNTKDEDLGSLLRGLYALGPKLVLITDGPNGAYMYDGNKSYFMPIYPDVKAPFERTGCGDAFAAPTFEQALHAEPHRCLVIDNHNGAIGQQIRHCNLGRHAPGQAPQLFVQHP